MISGVPISGITVISSWLKAYQDLGDKEFRVQRGALFEKLKKKRVIIYFQPASLSLDIHRYVYKLEIFWDGSAEQPGDGSRWPGHCQCGSQRRGCEV
jgi:hypothetical protein